MEVAVKIIFAAQEFRSREHFVHRACATAGNATRNKNRVSQTRAVHLIESTSKFFWLKCCASDIAPAPHRAVKAILFARVGLEDLEHHDLAAIGKYRWINPA